MQGLQLPRVLAINGGSSSIRFSLFQQAASLERILTGKIDRIGLDGTTLSVRNAGDEECSPCNIETGDYLSATHFLAEWLDENVGLTTIEVIGHRIVHGMRHTSPEPVTDELIEELRQISSYASKHLPGEIQLIETFQAHCSGALHVACFDTAFHQTMPTVAKLLPLPRRYSEQGIERYGFHGISYSYLMEELMELGDPAAANGKVILAHLGNGASLAAVRDGKSVDTSMGFTPTAGVPMSTRSGDLDPGLVDYLARSEGMDASQFNELVNSQSGLLGVSETSSDVRDLLEVEEQDQRAAEAIALFCYQVKKWIGAFAATLGGVETLVFSGGIGENAPVIRWRICEGLSFLGLELDPELNRMGADVISTQDSRVTVRVIHTDEEIMIARSAYRLLEA